MLTGENRVTVKKERCMVLQEYKVYNEPDNIIGKKELVSGKHLRLVPHFLQVLHPYWQSVESKTQIQMLRQH